LQPELLRVASAVLADGPADVADRVVVPQLQDERLSLEADLTEEKQEGVTHLHPHPPTLHPPSHTWMDAMSPGVLGLCPSMSAREACSLMYADTGVSTSVTLCLAYACAGTCSCEGGCVDE
jgi:hypothetical protein